ncbi:hypothetical protein [Chitinasiproducens palmae]|uniref:Uncharacterized protein n=1 Tax=Chitinasiproducens palmae TaxID=1770053 RepID=A0A1H2PTQ9_9BURK|nr:hypothetical protein [Chitinasiproducens palmae]SDV50524.1 hypothetical protein SAMN05216551_11258 [Chitinasiproducens palmae]
MKPDSLPTADDPRAANDDAVLDIVERGPKGALWVAGIATAIVFAIWFIFYFAAYVPRGAVS